MSFETTLFERTNDILLSYQDVTTDKSTDPRANGGGSTVGIRDASGQSNGRNLQWSFDQKIIRSRESICYSANSSNKCLAVPFEFSPGLSLLALGGLFAAERLNSKFRQRKFSKSEFSSN